MNTCICTVGSVTCICCLSPNTVSKSSCDEFWYGETLLKGVTVYHTVKRRDRNSLYIGDIYQRIHAVKLNRPCCRTCEGTYKINLQIKQHISISTMYITVICKRTYNIITFSMDYYPDRGFPCFRSVVRQMLGYSSQRRGKVRILTSAQSRVNGLLYVLLVLIVVVICNFGL